MLTRPLAHGITTSGGLLAAAWLPLAAACAPAFAGVPDGQFVVRLEPVASGLTAPVQLKTTPIVGDTRLFVVDQAGRIRIIQNGALLPAPFLDLTSIIVPLNPGFDERGLLGLAFSPDYATSGRFFVHYTIARTGAAGEPCVGTTRGCSSEVLAEFRVSADPNVADAASRTVLLTVPKPQFNHCGGFLDFGPDGYLYMSLGDGGGANDGLADTPPSHGPTGNAQNLATPLGKMLRFDVSTPGTLNFPASNPFLATPGAYGGVYAYGLRNPYSATFDDGPGGTGRLFIADVGQNLYEEVDILQPGANFGWPIREGLHCFDPFAPNVSPATCPGGFVDPIAEYGRTVGISVISGGVYRGGAMPHMNGMYIFGDFSTAFATADGHLFYLDPSAVPPAPIRRLRLGNDNHALGLYVKGFGRDKNHEVYLLASSSAAPTGTGGVVLRLAPCPADHNGLNGSSVQDIYDFLTDWAAQVGQSTPGLSADFNGVNGVTVQDIYDFLTVWSSGCV